MIGAAAGVFALAGGQIAQALLGSSYSSDVGAELGRLVVVFSLWAVVSVGVSVTFPLVFVAGRGRALPLIAVAAVVLQLALAWSGSGCSGSTASPSLSRARPAAVLAALLVGPRRARPDRARARARGAHGGRGTVLAYVPPGLLLPAVAAAAVGLGVYAALLAVVRPAGFVDAWRYLRALA